MDQTAVQDNLHYFCHRCTQDFYASHSNQQSNVTCPACNDDFIELLPNQSNETENRNNTHFSRSGGFPISELSQTFFVPEALIATIYQFYERLAMSGPPPASSDELSRLVDYMITQEDIDNQKDCPICMENFNLDEITKRLPCKHAFHEQCIMQWLEQRGTCPVCRRNLQGTDTSRQEFVVPLNIDGTTINRASDMSQSTTQIPDNIMPDNASNRNFGNSIYDTAFVLASNHPLIMSSNRNVAMGRPEQQTSFSINSDNIPSPNGGNAVLRATVSAHIQRSNPNQTQQPTSPSSNSFQINVDSSSTEPTSQRFEISSHGSSTSSTSPSFLQNLQSRMSNHGMISRLYRRYRTSDNRSNDNNRNDSQGSDHMDTNNASPLQDDLD